MIAARLKKPYQKRINHLNEDRLNDFLRTRLRTYLSKGRNPKRDIQLKEWSHLPRDSREKTESSKVLLANEESEDRRNLRWELSQIHLLRLSKRWDPDSQVFVIRHILLRCWWHSLRKSRRRTWVRISSQILENKSCMIRSLRWNLN